MTTYRTITVTGRDSDGGSCHAEVPCDIPQEDAIFTFADAYDWLDRRTDPWTSDNAGDLLAFTFTDVATAADNQTRVYELEAAIRQCL